MNEGGTSKKVTIAGMAITAIGSSDNLHARIVIAVVAVAGIVVQGWLDKAKG